MSLKRPLIIFFICSLFCIGPGLNIPNLSTSIISANGIHYATSPGSSDPNQDEWPMFRRQLNHTGTTLTTSVYGKGAIWNFATEAWIYSSPAVTNGRLYIGSYDSKIYCLNASTGKHLWNYTLGAATFSSPAVADGRVYIGCINREIYCLNASTGGLLWNYTTGSGVYCSPTVAGGRVYVGSFDTKVYCLNATTGSHLWNYTTEGGVQSSPAVADGRVYMGSFDGQVYCLNAITGAPLWNYTMGASLISSPAVADGRVSIGCEDGTIYCLNATTGSQFWNYTTAGLVRSSPAVAGGRIYVGSTDGSVYCLDATTGSPLWTYPTGDIVQSSPAVAGGRIYIGSDDNKVYCLNANTGAQLWNYTTLDDVYSSPAVALGRVYVGSLDTKVYCLPTVFDLQPPTYTTVTESADSLELGMTETITISGVADPAGIKVVLIEFTGANHTMNKIDSNTWSYNTWIPGSTGSNPYTIYFQDNPGNWNATTGTILVIDTTSPTYGIVMENSDPLELGITETITISGVKDLSGIQTVLIEFWNGNDTMAHSGGTTWRYSSWTPVTTGTYTYTIYIQDNSGNWNATTGSIQVVSAKMPPYLYPFLILGIIFAVGIFISLGVQLWSIRSSRSRNKAKSFPSNKGQKELAQKSEDIVSKVQKPDESQPTRKKRETKI